MSLNQKYTWHDFLKENPDFKERNVKRTSPEGEKAFEAAYKSKIKDILKDRLASLDSENKRCVEKREKLTTEIKEAKKGSRKKVIQAKIGKVDKYISRIDKFEKRTKEVQKNI